LQLELTADEGILLHAVVERYLDQLRTESGHDESIRPLLDAQQDMLIEIQARLHTLARRASSTAMQLPLQR
jgi:hypothetical protein